jgi:hypothetical protein
MSGRPRKQPLVFADTDRPRDTYPLSVLKFRPDLGENGEFKRVNPTTIVGGIPYNERYQIMPMRTPQSIPELWYAIDKRLSLMEETQRSHDQVHAAINKIMDDHETRLRSSGAGALVAASVTSFLSVLAILKAFLK